MKSNINETILKILDEMQEKNQIEINEKEFFLDALKLEYENNTKKKPQLDGKYFELVNNHSD